MPSLSLTLDCRPSEVPRLLAEVEDFVRPHAPPPKTLRHFFLALEEIVLNAILHGGQMEGARLRVDVTLDSGEIRAEMVDGGAAFDPFAEAPEPDLDAPLESRRIGGLGVHLTKTLMDTCRYERRGELNHTLLGKRLA